MPDPSRHVALPHRAWDAARAAAAIRDIVADALDHLDPDRLWPAHPLDGDVPDGHGSLYFGAAGVIWALHRLGVSRLPDGTGWSGLLATAARRNAPWFAEGPYPAHASLLFGDLGVLLVRSRVAPSAGLADEIHARIAINGSLPTVELMWGLPGSMLACRLMADRVPDPRFKHEFRVQAGRLLAEVEETAEGRMWIQDLYGRRSRLLSAVHGFAGNVIPLLRGWDWLDAGQRATLSEFVPNTLAVTAVASRDGVNWPASLPWSGPVELCQHCHGAPGIVSALAEAPFSTPAFESLLVRAGEFVWRAGPLAKGANLCHGTAGNGYAFLKLFSRTRDGLWLERARTFAMAALDQVEQCRSAHGRGRFSLWTGDLGTALFVEACIAGRSAFPTIDEI